jgi:hypothetical protein
MRDQECLDANGRRRIDNLKRIAELAKKVEAGKGDDTPEKLDTAGKRAAVHLEQAQCRSNASRPPICAYTEAVWSLPHGLTQSVATREVIRARVSVAILVAFAI